VIRAHIRPDLREVFHIGLAEDSFFDEDEFGEYVCMIGCIYA
jgi:hypothetical protein